MEDVPPRPERYESPPQGPPDKSWGPSWAMKKNLGCLGYIGDDTTQVYRVYNEPL